MPILVSDSPLMLVPFAMERKRGLFEHTSYGTSFGPGYGFLGPARFEWFKFAPEGTHWHNILLADRRTGATRLLLDHRALVLGVEIAPQPDARDPGRPAERIAAGPPPFLIFRVVQQDTNGDKLLTEKDATVLYLCDGSGRDVRQVTPDGTQTWSWQWDAENEALYLMVASDGDGDGKFTTKDETRLMRLDLKRQGGSVAEPMGTESFRQATELLR
jgi:hypothetical protein